MRPLLFLLLAIASLTVLGGALMKIQYVRGAYPVMVAGMVLEIGCAAIFLVLSLRSR